LILLARDEGDLGLADGAESLRLAARAADPQLLLPTQAAAAHISCELGDAERAAALAQDFLSHLEARRWLGHELTGAHFLSWTFTTLGRGDEIAAVLAEQTAPVAQAAFAFAEGDPVRAAEIFGGIGAVTEEAYTRLAAARMLVAEGRRSEADGQLQRALAFYRSVGATRYVREGESLLAASA